jgi:hypothetical protein
LLRVSYRQIADADSGHAPSQQLVLDCGQIQKDRVRVVGWADNIRLAEQHK